jgi:hypothetical protein
MKKKPEPKKTENEKAFEHLNGILSALRYRMKMQFAISKDDGIERDCLEMAQGLRYIRHFLWSYLVNKERFEEIRKLDEESQDLWCKIRSYPLSL